MNSFHVFYPKSTIKSHIKKTLCGIMTVLGLYIAHRQHRHKFANNRRKIKITAQNSSKLTILSHRKIAHKSCGGNMRQCLTCKRNTACEHRCRLLRIRLRRCRTTPIRPLRGRHIQENLGYRKLRFTCMTALFDGSAATFFITTSFKKHKKPMPGNTA